MKCHPSILLALLASATLVASCGVNQRYYEVDTGSRGNFLVYRVSNPSQTESLREVTVELEAGTIPEWMRLRSTSASLGDIAASRRGKAVFRYGVDSGVPDGTEVEIQLTVRSEDRVVDETAITVRAIRKRSPAYFAP